jgi:fucose permease
MAMTLALNNVFCGNLHPPSVILGAAHGSYGIGGVVAPIVATALASRGILWSRFYFVPFALAIFSLIFAGWAFWDYQEESSETLLERNSSRQADGEEKVSRFHDLKLALRSRSTIFGALFIFAYQVSV